MTLFLLKVHFDLYIISGIDFVVNFVKSIRSDAQLPKSGSAVFIYCGNDYLEIYKYI